MGKVRWGWLLGGAALGAVGTTVYSVSQKTTQQVTMNNAGFGAGAGLLLGGIAAGLAKKSGASAAVGGLGGLAVLGLLWVTSATPTPAASPAQPIA